MSTHAHARTRMRRNTLAREHTHRRTRSQVPTASTSGLEATPAALQARTRAHTRTVARTHTHSCSYGTRAHARTHARTLASAGVRGRSGSPNRGSGWRSRRPVRGCMWCSLQPHARSVQAPSVGRNNAKQFRYHARAHVSGPVPAPATCCMSRIVTTMVSIPVEAFLFRFLLAISLRGSWEVRQLQLNTNTPRSHARSSARKDARARAHRTHTHPPTDGPVCVRYFVPVAIIADSRLSFCVGSVRPTVHRVSKNDLPRISLCYELRANT
jgi:hypothetical protein